MKTNWLQLLKNYVDTLETIVGTEGGVALADKLTAARAALLDQITALRMAELDPANLPADVAASIAAIAALNDLAQGDILSDATPFAGADIAAILADVTGIAGAAMRGTDGAALAASWTAALATALGNYTAARAAYLDELAAANIPADTDPKVMGRLQIKATTIDLNQIAGTYDLFTGSTQDVIVEKLVLRCPALAAGGALTSISIQSDDATPIVLIDNVAGAVANLTSEAQLAWTGAMLLDAGTGAKIRLTINGGAHGVAYVCDVVAECRAVVSGGYLA